MINFWKTWKFPHFLSIFGQKNTSKMIISGRNIDFHKNFSLTNVDQHKMLYQMGYKMVIFALFATQNLPSPQKKSVVPQGDFLNSFAKSLCFTHSKSKESIEKCVLIYLTI